MLLPQHQALIDNSAISPQIAEQRGYRTVIDHADLAKLGFADFQCRTPALLVPVFGVHGDVVNFQLRPDRPRIRRDKQIKYETVSGSAIHIDAPPSIRVHLGNPAHPLLITEGIRKADSAVSHGGVCIALTGVWNFRGRNRWGGLTALGDWELIHLKDRPVYIAFDSDVMTKPSVRLAMDRLGAFLKARGARVQVVYLPQATDGKVGLDDFLASGHTIEDVYRLASPLHQHVNEKPPGYRERQMQRSEFPFTDLGNAERLVSLHGSHIRWVPSWGFLTWQNGLWVRDADQTKMLNLAQHTVREIARSASLEKNHAVRDFLIQWSHSSERYSRTRAIIEQSKGIRQIQASVADFDNDPTLLNVANGTLDLQTGRLRPHHPFDFISKMSNVSYEPQARCPRFMNFLHDVFVGDLEMLSWIQRLCGYLLSGNTSEQVLPIFWGTGSNGKSTLLTILRTLLGTYASHAETQTFLPRRQVSTRSDLAALAGARLVTAVESRDGDALDEVLIKQMTGGDPITCRFLYQNEFTYVPQFKPILAVNDKPIIRGTDFGIWRRIRLVPFEVTFDETRQDKTIIAKLLAELPGILNWAMDGYQKWKTDGLGQPDSVRNATKFYRQEQDLVGRFVSEQCVEQPRARIPVKVLFDAFTGWCRIYGEEPVSPAAFKRGIERRGHTQNRTSTLRYWAGLELGPRGLLTSQPTRPRRSSDNVTMDDDESIDVLPRAQTVGGTPNVRHTLSLVTSDPLPAATCQDSSFLPLSSDVDAALPRVPEDGWLCVGGCGRRSRATADGAAYRCWLCSAKGATSVIHVPISETGPVVVDKL